MDDNFMHEASAQPQRVARAQQPGLFRRGRTYYYQFTVRGVRYKGTTGQTDKAKAMEVARHELLRVQAGAPVGVDPKAANASILFKIYKERRLPSPKSRASHDTYSRRFLEFFGDIPLAAVSPYRAEEYRDWLAKQTTSVKQWNDQKPLSAKTQREHLVWLGAVCHYHALPNPVAGIKRARTERRKILQRQAQFWSAADEEKLLQAAKGSVYEAALTILLFTGCRPAELRALCHTPDEIDNDRHTLRLCDKRGRVRGLILEGRSELEEAWQALLKWIEVNKVEPGKPLFPQGPTWFLKSWTRILKRAGLPYCRLHTCRHAFVRRAWLTWGWDLAAVAKWCGHSLATCAEVYGRLCVVAPPRREAPKVEPLRRGKLKGRDVVTLAIEDYERLLAAARHG